MEELRWSFRFTQGICDLGARICELFFRSVHRIVYCGTRRLGAVSWGVQYPIVCPALWSTRRFKQDGLINTYPTFPERRSCCSLQILCHSTSLPAIKRANITLLHCSGVGEGHLHLR